MEFKLFSVYDVKAGAYLPMFTMPNEALAVRAFSDSLCDGDHAFSRHPEDYHLFAVGSWNDDNADIVPDKKIVLTGSEAIAAITKEMDTTVESLFPKQVDKEANVN